ncbi:uncharacterized protein Dmoj_GI25649 [Drosophila mojavensis]|uniref:Uncharacterized protein n=1 Tax=Drosophila mojavensis TaxID=7230 RepID=A0A0Q9WX08_DROMO|nr:uncharacterized protein Dmoj_GI25649 [Drosophila mojavensis]
MQANRETNAKPAQPGPTTNCLSNPPIVACTALPSASLPVSQSSARQNRLQSFDLTSAWHSSVDTLDTVCRPPLQQQQQRQRQRQQQVPLLPR